MKGLDVEGVDISVIYGPLYATWADGMDPRFSAALARAYNRWLADYSADSGRRILGAAPFPIQDLDLALAEVDYCYDILGIKAFWVRPNPVNGRMLGDRVYDRLYEALQERDAPLSLHEGMGAIMPTAGADRFHTWTELHSCCHPMEQQMAMLSMMMQGSPTLPPAAGGIHGVRMLMGPSLAPSDGRARRTYGVVRLPRSRAQAERVLPSQLLHLVRPR